MGVELMGRSQLQRFSALNDAIGHQAPEALAFRNGSPKWAWSGHPRAGRALRATAADRGLSLRSARRQSDVGQGRLGDAERTKGPAQAKKRRHANGEIKDLDISERPAQAFHEGIVNPRVIGCEQLRVLDGEPLLLGQRGAVDRIDGAVELFIQSLRPDLVGPNGDRPYSRSIGQSACERPHVRVPGGCSCCRQRRRGGAGGAQARAGATRSAPRRHLRRAGCRDGPSPDSMPVCEPGMRRIAELEGRHPSNGRMQ